nr:hypothetical protein [Kibdelosporangium sp. MJ126-NF4]
MTVTAAWLLLARCVRPSPKARLTDVIVMPAVSGSFPTLEFACGTKKDVLAGRQAAERETNTWSVHPVGSAHVTSRAWKKKRGRSPPV